MSQPLDGFTVVVCRPADQAHDLISGLENLGASVVRLPLLEIVGPPDGGVALAAAARRIDEFDWVTFTSANSVRALVALVDQWPSSTLIAAVGPATAEAATESGLGVAFMPADATASALAQALPLDRRAANDQSTTASVRILAPLAELASSELITVLGARGAVVESVVAYASALPRQTEADLAAAREADAVLLTSGSTADRLIEVLGLENVPPVVVAIGPSTAEVARRRGLEVAAVADQHTTDGLIAATVRSLA